MTLTVGFVTISAWIGMAVGGSFVTAFNLRDALRDNRALRSLGYANGRALVAKVSLWNEALRLLSLVLLIVAGILVAWKQYNPNPPPTSIYVRSVVLVTIASLVSQSISLRWLRHRIR